MRGKVKAALIHSVALGSPLPPFYIYYLFRIRLLLFFSSDR